MSSALWSVDPSWSPPADEFMCSSCKVFTGLGGFILALRAMSLSSLKYWFFSRALCVLKSRSLTSFDKSSKKVRRPLVLSLDIKS